LFKIPETATPKLPMRRQDQADLVEYQPEHALKMECCHACFLVLLQGAESMTSVFNRGSTVPRWIPAGGAPG
jgi:hypothetical protein